MNDPKTPSSNRKPTDQKIETVEDPAKSSVRNEGQIPAKGQNIEKPLKEAVENLDAPSKK